MDLGWLEVSFDVKDVGRTIAFYEALGFRVASRADQGMSAILQGGTCRLGLYQNVLRPAETQLIFWQGEVERCAEGLPERAPTSFGRWSATTKASRPCSAIPTAS
jgi:catechol 2,3-dioxygenase-like lactoylglutathione lyase family enzyme